jgi:fused signal recognition particle receptor
MFGSNDDNKTPALGTTPTAPVAPEKPAEKAGEKKDLFAWLRKKTQAPTTAGATPAAESAAVESTTPAAEADSPPVSPTAVAPAPTALSPVSHATAPPAASSLPMPAPIRVAAEPLASVEPLPIAAQMPMPAPIRVAVPLAGVELAPATASSSAPALSVAPAGVDQQSPLPIEPVSSSSISAPDVVPGVPPAATPRASRFRFNAGSEVLHEHLDTPPVVVPQGVAEPIVLEPIILEPMVLAPVAPAMPAAQTKAGFLDRLKQGLSKTSASIGEGMASLFLGKKAIDDDLLEELETRLLMADVGVEATTVIIQSLTQKVARKQLTDSGALYKALQEELAAMLRPVAKPLVIPAANKPFVILVVGVNGAGKTTTIGKLAKKLQLEGKKVMLAAGDTFRAAAVEQLQVWGERNQVTVIAQHTGADSASVIFDAVQAATARGMDVLIADTAGRLHTKDNLMEELKKVRRVIGKLDEAAPHEVLLVLDAGTGQNAISQAKQFNQTVNLTGLALTKLDGTAKGGVIFALAKQFGIPIRYIGVGEGIDDLRTFEAESFVEALFAGAAHNELERP